MDNYYVYTFNTFDKIYLKLDRSEQIWIQRIIENLETNPYGKILRFSWLREKKHQNKRLYYIVDDITQRILIIAFAPKKDQQETINYIVKNKKEFFTYLNNQS